MTFWLDCGLENIYIYIYIGLLTCVIFVIINCTLVFNGKIKYMLIGQCDDIKK